MPQTSSTPPGAPVTLTFEAGMLHLAAPRGFDPHAELGLDGWRWDKRFERWACFGMGYRPFRKAAHARGFKVRDEAYRWQSVDLSGADATPLRDYQEEAIAAWEAAGKRGLVVLPTGTGKTEVALAIMRRVGASALVVSPVRDLMHQWHRRIQQALGYEAGIIGDRDHEVRPISVTTYQSACIFAEKLGADFKLIIFDECHHLSGRMKTDAARLSVAPYRLGLTATPRLGDEATAGFEALIGPVCYQRPLSAVRGEHVADYGTTHISVELTPEERDRYEEHGKIIREYQARRRQEKPGWEWQRCVHAEAATDPEARRALHAWRARKRIEDRATAKLDILEDLFRLHPADPTLVFVAANTMARDVSARFLVPCLTAEFGGKERRHLLDGFARGDYPVLVANKVLNEGVDLPNAKVEIVLGGSGSPAEHVQRLGRILRKRGNQTATFYEVVCAETGEVARSRRRRHDSDAYEGMRHRRG